MLCNVVAKRASQPLDLRAFIFIHLLEFKPVVPYLACRSKMGNQ